MFSNNHENLEFVAGLSMGLFGKFWNYLKICYMLSKNLSNYLQDKQKPDLQFLMCHANSLFLFCVDDCFHLCVDRRLTFLLQKSLDQLWFTSYLVAIELVLVWEKSWSYDNKMDWSNNVQSLQIQSHWWQLSNNAFISMSRYLKWAINHWREVSGIYYSFKLQSVDH